MSNSLRCGVKDITVCFILLKIVEVYVIKELLKIFKQISSKHIMNYFRLGYGE